MSSHFRWYPSDEDLTVPWNARYTFPSQSNKAEKLTPRIPPKSGSSFSPGQTIRLEFPAQGYVNPANTTLEFDVTLYPFLTNQNFITRFQNNIQSIFSRVRLLYGATPLEDIINYNQIVRSLTEWTCTNNKTMDQTSICEGIGGTIHDLGDANYIENGDVYVTGLMNVRQKYIQGVTEFGNQTETAESMYMGPTAVVHPVGIWDTPQGLPPDVLSASTNEKGVTRRYQVQLMLGILSQEKLIPTKWMASQLAIEITLERPEACIYTVGSLSLPPGRYMAGETAVPYSDAAAVTTTRRATYGVGNVNLLPEILQFDASYDQMFLTGLKNEGVPIKFSSWHTNVFSTSSASNVSLNIQERSRSVKAMFAVQKRPIANYGVDNGATFFDTSVDGKSSLQTYQFRLGGRYYPASPVQCSTSVGSAMSNGGSEAYVELAKALNILGDYRLSSSCDISRWAIQPCNSAQVLGVNPAASTSYVGVLPEYDYSYSIIRTFPDTGIPSIIRYESSDPAKTRSNGFCGTLGSSCFAMAVNLETSNGLEISGLNGEEQSDFQLLAQWKGSQTLGSADPGPANIEVYSYYDAMLILKENNLIELIQ